MKSARCSATAVTDVIGPGSVIRSQRIAVYNFDGIRRCFKCMCLHTSPEVHQRKCKGPVLVRSHGFRCLAGCGLVFSSVKAATNHGHLCAGLLIRRDRYGTCICPKCRVAGFSDSVVTKHTRPCSGNRVDTLNSYRGDRPILRCDECGRHLLRNALRTHSCYVVGDPVWLGEQAGPPDLSISATRWFRQNGLTLGGVPGELPAAVPDDTISVALYGDEHGTGDSIERVFDEEGSDSDKEEDDDSDEDEGVDGDGQGADTAGEGAAEKVAAAGINFRSFKDMPCEGVKWHHGYFACPFGSLITFASAHIRQSSLRGGKQLRISSSCRACASLNRRINKWLRAAKFTASGARICRRQGCHEPVAAYWHCRYHADQITRINHAGEMRRGVQNTISPEALAAFRQSVRPRRLDHPLWRTAKAAFGAPAASAASRDVLYVDTESVYDRSRCCFLVCELTVIASDGTILVDTTVDHGLSYAQLRARVDPPMWAKLLQLYNFSTMESPTVGQSLHEIAAILRPHLSASAAMVEWSQTGFDNIALRRTFGDLLPLPDRPLLGHELWKELDLPGSVALQPLFASAFPDSPLNRNHRRSGVDAEKLRLMVAAALEHFVMD